MITAADAKKNFDNYHKKKWESLEQVLARIDGLSKKGHNCMSLLSVDWNTWFDLNLLPELEKLGFQVTKRYDWILPFVKESEPWLIKVWWAKL